MKPLGHVVPRCSSRCSSRQLVRRRGPLPVAEATRILRDAAWALGYGHARGVVHRDVKPDNLLVEKESGRTLVTERLITGSRSP